MPRIDDDEIRALIADTERDPETFSTDEVVDRATRPHRPETYRKETR